MTTNNMTNDTTANDLMKDPTTDLTTLNENTKEIITLNTLYGQIRQKLLLLMQMLMKSSL